MKNSDVLGGDFDQSDTVGAIKSAASFADNVSADELMRIAKAESNLNPNAKAATSSATGLFQFTKGTWKEMVRKYGRDAGIGLKDIKDPQANAIMGSLFVSENKTELTNYLGREPSLGEVYSAHVLGVGTAKKLLRAPDSAKVSSVLPKNVLAANAFMRGKTVGQLKQIFERKMI